MNKVLRSLRAKHGDTQRDLAEFLGITVNTLSFKENGKYKFTLEEAYKISQRYSTPLEEIFFKDLDVITTTKVV
ncbi:MULTISPECIES: helix-turn-helix domain-containing protein [unclassified Clostridium]|uniref:helix-turn-helix transcriptional regulator n=1 Tax=unclassified Clostridium TaxID=2614128 RepID=UPI000297935B|nr:MULTISPECIES: helix-turn-helix domain-containing protein [unclassified Clostridium]EKQ56335.1 MAG: putative transcriptional regulator [Clostridium sp. Maddingley MBC34-26]